MKNNFINPSGFYENLPPEQIVEDTLKLNFQKIAKSYGYAHLETASVEYIHTLASKGDINKEVYTIGRVLAEESEAVAGRGLHFDLTIPFARYVAQHQSILSFPYRRYQIQKVWRGERPQKGRFREFYQADIDVVTKGSLPVAFDAEVALVMASIIDSFNLGSVIMHISNRKFLSGIFEWLNINPEDYIKIFQIIDKLDKINVEVVQKRLVDEIGLSSKSTNQLFEILSQTITTDRLPNFFNTLPIENSTLQEAITELTSVFKILGEVSDFVNFSFVFNPKIVRGLDYYTGTVYETFVEGREHYGSICSGGRYADLTSRFSRQKMPGVGMSIGLTRLLSILKEEKLVSFDKKTNSNVSILVMSEDQLIVSFKTAELLRKNGLNVEINYRTKDALGRQIQLIEGRGILFGVVCEKNGSFTVYKNNFSKEIFEEVTSLIKFLIKTP